MRLDLPEQETHDVERPSAPFRGYTSVPTRSGECGVDLRDEEPRRLHERRVGVRVESASGIELREGPVVGEVLRRVDGIGPRHGLPAR